MTIAQPVPRYTLEDLQQSYELSITQALGLIEKFGGEKASIDRFMRRCSRRRRLR